MVEFRVSSVVCSLVIYGFFIFIFWKLPSVMGFAEYSLSMKLILSVLLLPVCWFIVERFNE